ncbi:mannose-1-phosphate guanylyltransferase/mannose-6-phosphate isomerase [Desulfomicrobium baculatum]|uniref:mannose-1-phosphate guanylyltransferase n=1 Tax=Desulfomicrobium baculatum (strain DSM 4028 / VKM B-1378 / X) TaxID=525897 RepID=C7LS88_DESBD|nr:mannose-1-phosphate guanylyltransferase/mannose-6-phosphate isomerase [Desulfomicrobium baculatum]ACU90636.1 mannose-1-phosphate guanylyltransferase/mannose- 6-phosphate isomerase [Desulfomicrobium baculatum DSM 4028]
MIIPVILAGGSGTRLWPLSRQLYPKQFLPLVNGKTLFQETALRLGQNPEIAPPIVVCNEEHRFMVAEQARQQDVQLSKIVLEPAGKNTAPAAYVAARLASELHDDPILLVLPADHHIRDLSMLLSTIEIGASVASAGSLVTFGIVPQYAETGYGYIERGEQLGVDSDAFHIKRFVEKPDTQTAQSYLDSGKFYWNSGMFMFSAKQFMQELERFRPEMADACQKAIAEGKSDLDFFRLDAANFESCPSDSIDYAVMEHTAHGAVIPLYAGWNDIGSWSALWDVKDKDENQNVAIGDVVSEDSHGSYMHSTGRLLAVVGVRDHVIVETADAVMVSPKDRVQDVKKLVDKLKSKKRPEVSLHKKVYRPWGTYETINLEDRFQVKRITVKPGAVLSLQKHHHRAEHWVVVRGTALVTRGEESLLLKEDESTYIPLGFMHRLENPGKIDLELVEVQTGSYLGEDDIVRVEDVYGRGN